MTQQLTDLIDSLIATEEFPTNWEWAADPDGMNSDYVACTRLSDGRYTLESGGSGVDAVQLDLTVAQLREIHRKLTIQLAVITRQQQED